MSHERRVGIRFESRARGALRGPRAALHRVAGRAPAARPCVRLIAIGEAVSRLSCSRRLVCTPGPSIAHKLYPRVPRGAPGTATAQPSGQPRKPETDSRKLPSGSAWNSVGIAATRPPVQHAANRNRETPLPGRSRARSGPRPPESG